jgi:hypothetical protein
MIAADHIDAARLTLRSISWQDWQCTELVDVATRNGLSRRLGHPRRVGVRRRLSAHRMAVSHWL